MRSISRVLLPVLACGAMITGCAAPHSREPASAGSVVVAHFATRPADFRFASFADSEHGLALGETQGQVDSRQLLATQDGGVTWRTVPSPAGWTFQDVRLADARRGFGVAVTPGCLSGEGKCTDAILSTADGGRTWRRASPPPGQYEVLWSHGERALIEESPACLQLSCPNRSVLYVTMDGGQHWRALAPPGRLPQFAGVGFSSATKGLGLDVAGHVYATESGGRTWTPLAVLRRQGAGFNPGRTSFSFAGGRDFVAFCDLNDIGNGGCGNNVFRSDDGERTWRQIYATYCMLSLHIAMRDAHSGVMVSAGYAACSGSWPPISDTVYATSDGGASWMRTWTFPDIVAGSGFLSPERGWVVGGGTAMCDLPAACAPLVAWTEDGGRTWRQAYPALAPTTAIARTSAGNLMGIGTALDPQAVLAEQGGRWRWVGELRQAAVGHPVGMLAFASGRVGWAAAAQGPLFETVDGGRTWRELAWPGPTSVQIAGLAAERGGLLVLGQSIGCMGTSSCPITLWRLEAGSPQPTRVHVFPGSWQFTGLAFTSPSRGYALGNRCPPCEVGLWQTTDRGQHWSRTRLPKTLGVPTNLGSPAPGILALQSPTDYALRTNPGSPWRRVALSGPDGVSAVQLLQTGSGELWLLASDGLLFRSSDGGRNWH